MSKLDALLFQWTSMNRPESGSTGTAETVTVTVVCSGTRDLLTAAGLEIQHELAGIFTGNVRMSALPALEAVPEVLAIAAMIPEVPQTNESVPGIRAPSVWTGTPPRQGEGVLIGIVDSGIDIFHGAFRAGDGSTRVLAIWDQSLPSTQPAGRSGPAGAAGPGSIGRVFSEADINAALRGRPEDFEHFDAMGHGTHVAGIAGGDGSQAGNAGGPGCPLAGTYQGVAPAARFLIVKTAFGRVTHGVEWVFEQAAGRPTVVNLSSSCDAHQPRNGYGFNAVRLDRLLEDHSGSGAAAARPGRAIVVAAGNEGDGSRHAAATIEPGTVAQVEFELLGPQPNQVRLLALYGTPTAPGAPQPADTEALDVTLRFPNETGTFTVSAATPTAQVDTGNFRVSAVRREHHPWGTGGAGGVPRVWGMHAVDIVLTPSNGRLPGGVWELEFFDRANRRTLVDLYAEMGQIQAMPPVPARGTFTFNVAFQNRYSQIEAAIITYQGAARLDVHVVHAGSRSEAVSPGQTRTLRVGRDEVQIRSLLEGPDSPGRHRITVTLVARSGELLNAGTCSVVLVETAGHAVEPRCYAIDERPHEGFMAPFTVQHPERARTLSNSGRNVVIVGAVDDWFAETERSSRGPTQDGRNKPDLVAPGITIVAPMTNAGAPGISDCCGTFYTSMSGTSMASPHVAGAVALMLQKNPALTYETIRSLLTAHPLASTPAAPNRTGSGVVDVEAVVTAVPPPSGGGGGGGGPTTVRRGDEPSLPRAPSLRVDLSPQRLAHLQRAAASSESGRLLIALLSKHFDEAFRIVNTHRRAMACWHRAGGPDLARAVVRWSGEADEPIVPAEIGKRSVKRGLPYLLAALKRYGSPALRRDVARFGSFVTELPGKNLREVRVPDLSRTSATVHAR